MGISENSGISIAHAQPQLSPDCLKEHHVMARNGGSGRPPSPAGLPVRRSGLCVQALRGEFLESQKGKGDSHQDPAGSSVSIPRVKGGQGHNLGVYFQGKEV